MDGHDDDLKLVKAVVDLSAELGSATTTTTTASTIVVIAVVLVTAIVLGTVASTISATATTSTSIAPTAPTSASVGAVQLLLEVVELALNVVKGSFNFPGVGDPGAILLLVDWDAASALHGGLEGSLRAAGEALGVEAVTKLLGNQGVFSTPRS